MTEEIFQLINRPRWTKALIRMRETQINDLRLMMLPSGIRYDKDAVQTSPEDPMLKYAEKLLELEAEVKALKESYYEESTTLNNAIAKLDNVNEAEVLTCRYIGDMYFSDIAEHIHASESTVYRWHRKGIEHLTENDS